VGGRAPQTQKFNPGLNPNSEVETAAGSGTGSLPVVSRAGPGKNLPGGRSLNSTGKMPVPLPWPKPASEFGFNTRRVAGSCHVNFRLSVAGCSVKNGTRPMNLFRLIQCGLNRLANRMANMKISRQFLLIGTGLFASLMALPGT
jgi:hypothetical protein